MSAPDGGKRWMDTEVGDLRKAWLLGKAMGRKPHVVIMEVAAKLGRTLASVRGKLAQLRLYGGRAD